MQILTLRDLRFACGLSQAEVARRLAISRASICRYESLDRCIPSDTLDDFIDVCVEQARRS
jgi:transcriptional regulator with XRE-family HTH domain